MSFDWEYVVCEYVTSGCDVSNYKYSKVCASVHLY